MVLVDTSVWIDFFRNAETVEAHALKSLIMDHADICICGPILTGILQGICNDRQFRKTRDLLAATIYLPLNRDSFIHASELYRALRKKGFTVRKPIDCMIAAVAIEHEIPLLHNDRDFQPLKQHASLKIYPSS